MTNPYEPNYAEILALGERIVEDERPAPIPFEKYLTPKDGGIERGVGRIHVGKSVADWPGVLEGLFKEFDVIKFKETSNYLEYTCRHEDFTVPVEEGVCPPLYSCYMTKNYDGTYRFRVTE